jgi:hypothetical protein
VGFNQMSDDAKVNGVEVITLDKFLNQIGYAPDDRIVQLGAGARASDFPAEAEAGAGARNPTRTQPQFRPRSPSRPAGQTTPTGSGRYFRFGS